MISIITVSFNSSSTILDCVNSILRQDFCDYEHIIIDGGSTDNTLPLLSTYSEYITLISEPDLGIYDAMNKGIAIARGDIIGILNSDDFYQNHSVLSDIVKTFAKNPEVEMVFGNVDFVHPSNLERPVRFYSSNYFKPWKMRFGFMPAHPAAFIKSTAYQKIGNYKLGYKIAADFDWFVRSLVIKSLRYVTINKLLVRMRIGGVSTSGLKNNLLASREMLEALNESNIWSNYLLISLRFPFKFFQKLRSLL